MSIPGNLNFGGNPGGATRFSQTRGRLGGGISNGVNYPSPFFDIAHTYLPNTIKAMFRWCRYYFLTNPIINATVFKLSEYPITEIEIDHADKKVANKWKEYFEDHLNYRAFQIECGLDYNTYGNCLTSLSFPFKKFLTCRRCKFQAEAKRIRPNWVFTNYEFRLSCPQCGELGTADSKDQYFRNESGVRVMRWNPEDVEITYSDITGESTYFYNIPPGIRNDVIIGKKDAVEQVPEVFIQALRQQKGVVFSKDLFFHLRRPTLADQDRGWGLPLLLPCLKDTFYLQVMKKAQESILLEHIVPLRILFPQAGSGTSDPYCVTPDTLVETIDGLRPASEIAMGDYLRSHTGAWRHVEGTKARAVGVNEKVYKVVVDSLPGFPFKVSEEHPILAVPRTSNRSGRARQAWVDPAFIPIKDLRVGDYVAYPTIRTQSKAAAVDLGQYTQRSVTDSFVYRRLSQHAAEAYEWLEQTGDHKFAWGERKPFLEERGWSESDFATASAMRVEASIDRISRHVPLNGDLARLVGYFLAEGSLKEGGLPTFALGSDEHWIADDIMAAATALGFRGTTRYDSKLCNGLTVDVQDVLLGDLLSGLCGSGFAGKRVPQELAEASNRTVLRMLRALFAGDGCDFSTDTNRVALKMANPSIVLEARRLLLSFGLIGGIAKEVPKEGAISKSPSFHLAYNGEQADALRLLFCHGELPTQPWSKLGVLRGGYVLHRIASVEEVEEPTVIGFQMAEDKSFCVAGVATHNTTINLVDWRDHVATEIARWRYDCVSPESFVETSEGLKRASDIAMGDSLKNHLGTYSTVLAAVRRPLREQEAAYSLRVRGLSAVRTVLSEDHPLLAAKKYNNGNGHKVGQAEFIKVKDLQPGDYVGYPIARHEVPRPALDLAEYTTRASTTQFVYVDHHDPGAPKAFEYLISGSATGSRQDQLEANDWSVNQYKVAQIAVREGRTLRRLPRYVPFNAELAWALGLYTAEGNSTTKQVLFALHKEETSYVARLNAIFAEFFGAAPALISEKTENGIQAVFSSVIAADFFGSVCPGDSRTKQVPKLVKEASQHIVLSYLLGYLEGDGCFHADGVSNKTTTSTASLQLAEGVRQLLLSCEIPVGLSKSYGKGSVVAKTGRLIRPSLSYKLSICGTNNTQLRGYLAGFIEKIPTWSKLGEFRDGYFWSRIKEVTRVECEEVISIQTDPVPASAVLSDGERHGTFCVWGYASANCNYIPILPLPVGNQTIGGDGRALLMVQEMQQMSEQLINGMQVPLEFIKGGLSYAGTNISMRMLENQFIVYLSRHTRMAKWVMRSVADYLQWPLADIRFKPFKMADDIQRKAFLFQLNQAGKVSDTTLLMDSDLDQEKEDQIMERETVGRMAATKKQQLAQAELQGEQQVIMMKLQAKAQQELAAATASPLAPGEPGGPEGTAGASVPPAPMAEMGSPLNAGQNMGMNGGPTQAGQSVAMGGSSIIAMAQTTAMQLSGMDPAQQLLAIKELRKQSPELADLVLQMLQSMPNQQQQQQAAEAAVASAPQAPNMLGADGKAAVQVDMRPMPEKLPPRRAAGTV